MTATVTPIRKPLAERVDDLDAAVKRHPGGKAREERAARVEEKYPLKDWSPLYEQTALDHGDDTERKRALDVLHAAWRSAQQTVDEALDAWRRNGHDAAASRVLADARADVIAARRAWQDARS
jgi:hypothetical protein